MLDIQSLNQEYSWENYKIYPTNYICTTDVPDIHIYKISFKT